MGQWLDIEVIAETDCGARALELAAQLRPDLLLVDVVMPRMSGLELTRRLKRLAAPPCVLVLSLHTIASYRTAALAAGADDFLAKDEVTVALEPAIRRLFPNSPAPGVAA